MMAGRFMHALFAAVVAGVIIAPIFGFQIVRAGASIHLDMRWVFIWGGMLAVFVVQLIRPYILGHFNRRFDSFELSLMNPRWRYVFFLMLVDVAFFCLFYLCLTDVDLV